MAAKSPERSTKMAVAGDGSWTRFRKVNFIHNLN
jgi:hypothetical protein